MNIRRFFGKNSRDALSMVRKELGEDAVILSNRTVNGGNEIMAFKEEDMQAMVTNEAPARMSSEPMRAMPESTRPESFSSEPDMSEDPNEPTTLLSLLNRNNRAQAAEARSSRSESFNTRTESLGNPDAQDLSIHSTPANFRSNREVSNRDVSLFNPEQVSPQEANKQMADMLNEMRNMRSVIESQLTAMTWGNIQQRDPLKSKVLGALLAAGFSAALSRQLAEKMPAQQDAEKAMAWIRAILGKNLNTIENENEVLDRGGIFALIGPTGVGKTTTTAKLAARYVMKHGTQNLGLITTDAYRVGGHEQLRIYGKILGVMVYAVKDAADLKIALNELKHKHTILIDTVGVSQRDRMVAEQIAMLSNTQAPIKKLLCLNATSTGETLTDVISAYKGKGLDGCIITKMDEAATIGNTLDVIIREKLKLYYVANGQRVPEDIHLANKQLLIHHALKLNSAANQAFQFQSDELPFVMGNTSNATNALLAAEMNYV